MKICLIGAGRIGAVHAIAIASDENANLHSVVDFHQESAEKLANKYNAITLSMDEAFENNEILMPILLKNVRRQVSQFFVKSL